MATSTGKRLGIQTEPSNTSGGRRLSLVSNEEPYRRFVSVAHAWEQFQVIEGSEETNKPIQTADGLMFPPRVGDKFAEFQDGICWTNDPDVIEWLEEYMLIKGDAGGIWDADDPSTEARVALAKISIETASYEAQNIPDLEKINSKLVDSLVASTVEERVAAEMKEYRELLKSKGIDPDTLEMLAGTDKGAGGKAESE